MVGNVQMKTVVVVLEAVVKEQVGQENDQKPVILGISSSKTSRYFMSTGRFQRRGMKR